MLTSPLKKLALVLTTACLLQGCVAAAIGGAAVAGATKVATDPRTMGTCRRKSQFYSNEQRRLDYQPN